MIEVRAKKFGQYSVPKVQFLEIDNEDDAVAIIAKRIKQYSRDPQMRAWAAGILQDVPERDWAGELDAVFWFVKNNVRYTRDHLDIDTFQSPAKTLFEWKIGDCDDYVLAMGAILRAIGFPLRIVIVGRRSDFEHIYLLAGLPPENPREWLALDAAAANSIPGWEAGNMRVRKEFEV